MNKEEIIEIIKDGSIGISKLKILLSDMNPVDIAEVIGEFDRENALQLFRILPKVIASDVFSRMEPDRQKAIVASLTDTEIGEIVGRLFVDDAVDFIEEMPANVVNRVLKNVPAQKRKQINQILQYDDDSAGSVMTTEYVYLREEATVREAFDAIRVTALDKETIYTCYVVRGDRLLVGVVSAKTLMLAEERECVGDIMDANPVFARTTDDREDVAEKFKKYSLLAMPVVDKERRLVGIITVDDIVDVIIEESTEDFEKMGALSPSHEPYLKTNVLTLAGNRIAWLLILMLSATVTGVIISGFEEGLAAMPVLVAFIPMLMDTGGNAGSQASTLIIRGMALGEIRAKDAALIIWKEVRVAFLCGLALGIVNFIRVYVMNGRDILLCATVTLALLCTILMAKTVGCVLPIIAKRLKIDPAIMAAPLITTIVDGASLVVYFLIARIILGL